MSPKAPWDRLSPNRFNIVLDIAPTPPDTSSKAPIIAPKPTTTATKPNVPPMPVLTALITFAGVIPVERPKMSETNISARKAGRRNFKTRTRRAAIEIAVMISGKITT